MAAQQKQQRKKSTSRNDRLAMVIAHFLRLRIWIGITEIGPVSPNELSEILGEDLQDVSYHTRVLAKYDCIELAYTKQRRGATEHFYRVTERSVLSDEQTATRSKESRLMVANYAMQLIMADAAFSLEDGVFCDRANHCIVRQPVVLDEEGWEEVSAAYNELVEKVSQAEAKSAERRGPESDPKDEIRATAVSLFFERPPAIRRPNPAI